MQMQFYFKHMETSKSLQDYTTNKLTEKINRFVTKPVEMQIVFSVQGTQHSVQCTMVGGDGFNMDAHADTNDMYASVDLVVEKLVSQLKKQKEKIKHHKGHTNVRNFMEYSGKKSGNEGPDYVDAEDILKYEAARKKMRG